MVSLSCPLCCQQTFPSHTALKTHINNILENLKCPSCDQKMDDLKTLAEHLESECSALYFVEPQPRKDQSETEEDENAESLLESMLETKMELQEEQQYFCQMCTVHFNDVEGHMREFHEGQEVIMEEEEAEADSVLLIKCLEGESEAEEPEEEDSLPQKPAAVTENFTDKDGRLYTRKFVKIDKFWLPNQQKQSESQAPAGLPDCPNCSVIFPDEAHLEACLKQGKSPKKRNLKDPTLGGPFVCEICQTSFNTFKSLRLHKRMHEPIRARHVEAPVNGSLLKDDDSPSPVEEKFICKLCQKVYDKQYEEAHMKSHNETQILCQICNRIFFSKSNLEMHMKAHSNNKKSVCSYCKKAFLTDEALSEHMSTHCKKRAYECQFCGRRFARPHEKVKHERIHTGEKPHICEICGKGFRVSYCLTLHMRTHSGVRPYQCEHCLKRFKSHSVYGHHLQTHSEVRAYKCPFCPKAFKTSVQLAGHKNSHIKPFTCTECNRPFASLYAVRAHMETHKRDNNLKYECFMCGALYSRAFALRDHVKQQHQEIQGDGAKAIVVSVDDELIKENDVILGLDQVTNIEIIDQEAT